MLTKSEKALLIENGRQGLRYPERLQLVPVVCMHRPGYGTHYLLTELEPSNPDIAWGLRVLGVFDVECGPVSLEQLQLRGFENDEGFTARESLQFYVDRANA